MKQTIRLTESELRQIISESVRRVLNESIENDELNEGFGNWLRAGVNGLSNLRSYSQGPSTSKLVNFTSNVGRNKRHLDDRDTVQKAREYGCENAPSVQMAQAREHGYSAPGRRPVSDARKKESYDQMIAARNAQDRLNSYRIRNKAKGLKR